MRPAFLILLLLLCGTISAQDTIRFRNLRPASEALIDTTQTGSVLVLSELVGATIDSAEKAKYGVFLFWKKEEFEAAQIILRPDSSLLVTGRMKDGTIKRVPCSRADVTGFAYTINYRGGKIKDPPSPWGWILFGIVSGAIESIGEY